MFGVVFGLVNGGLKLWEIVFVMKEKEWLVFERRWEFWWKLSVFGGCGEEVFVEKGVEEGLWFVIKKKFGKRYLVRFDVSV